MSRHPAPCGAGQSSVSEKVGSNEASEVELYIPGQTREASTRVQQDLGEKGVGQPF